MIQMKLRGIAGAERKGVAQRVQASLSEGLRAYVQSIREVDVHFLDLNGPRGGVDKRCRLRLNTMPRGIAVVDGVASTYGEALGSAMEKAKRVLERKRGKRRAVRRYPKHGLAQRDYEADFAGSNRVTGY